VRAHDRELVPVTVKRVVGSDFVAAGPDVEGAVAAARDPYVALVEACDDDIRGALEVEAR